jgi:alkenylglycerophosphocholine hydrolase
LNLTLLYLCLLFAALDWLAVARRLKWLEYLAKPAVIVLLLAWLLQTGGFRSTLPWFAAGLLSALAGDILLMLPKQRLVPALIAFLFAHLSYIIGLNQPFPPLALPALAVFLVVLFPALRIFLRLQAGLEARGQSALRLPVAFYSLILSLMLLSALLTLIQPDEIWPSWPALLVSLGALMFFISDSLLAWKRFVNPHPEAHLTIHITYHLGQISLIAGVVLRTLAMS